MRLKSLLAAAALGIGLAGTGLAGTGLTAAEATTATPQPTTPPGRHLPGHPGDKPSQSRRLPGTAPGTAIPTTPNYTG